MAWRWARPRTTTDDDEDAIHLAFSTDRGGYKRWQAISSGTRRCGPPRHRGVRGKRSPARPSLVGTSQPPSRQPQESYDACARVEKTGFPGQFAHERYSASTTAGGHSAELDYTGPELAHSAELDYNGSHEMV